MFLFCNSNYFNKNVLTNFNRRSIKKFQLKFLYWNSIDWWAKWSLKINWRFSIDNQLTFFNWKSIDFFNWRFSIEIQLTFFNWNSIEINWFLLKFNWYSIELFQLKFNKFCSIEILQLKFYWLVSQTAIENQLPICMINQLKINW